MMDEAVERAASELLQVGKEYLNMENCSPEAASIPEALISNRGRLYRLVTNKEPNGLKIRKQGDVIEFDTPVYLEYVLVKTSSNPSEINIDFMLPGEMATHVVGKPFKGNPEYLVYWIKGFCQTISVSTSNVLIKPSIEAFTLYGYQLEDLHGISKDLSAFVQIENRLADKEKNLEQAIIGAIAEAKSQRDALDAESTSIREAIEKSQSNLAEHNKAEFLAQESRSQTESELEVIRNHLAETKSELNLAKDSSAKLNEQAVQLEDRIRTKRTEQAKVSNELELLKKEKSLYTDELSDYARHGDKTVITYVIVSLIPATTLLWYSTYIIQSASSLMTGNYATFEAAASAVIARVPFALVSSLIIAACFLSIETLFKRIIDLHKDRLFIHKLSILANHAVQSTIKNEELSADEMNRMVVQTKISLINDYLTRNSVLEQVENAPKKQRASLVDSFAKLIPSLGELIRRDS